MRGLRTVRDALRSRVPDFEREFSPEGRQRLTTHRISSGPLTIYPENVGAKLFGTPASLTQGILAASHSLPGQARATLVSGILSPLTLAGDSGEASPLLLIAGLASTALLFARSGNTADIGATNDPPPPPPPAVKEWGLYVVQVAGHGLEPDFHAMDSDLDRNGTTHEAHVVIRSTGPDGKLVNTAAEVVDSEGDGRFDRYKSGPEASRHLEKPVLDKDAMSTFLTEAAEAFPSDRTTVSFEGHSGQLRKAISSIHAALEALKKKIGRPVDVLMFDSCFMAQIEIATEFAELADYLVAFQEGVTRFRSFPWLARTLTGPGVMSPEQLATKIARHNKEFAASAMDLKKIRSLNEALAALGREILSISDSKALKMIRKAAIATTGYYAEGFHFSTHFSNTIDLRGFIKNIATNPYLRKNFPTLISATEEVLKRFGKKGEGVVIAERHAGTTDQYFLDYTNVDGSNGVSLHMPVAPKAIRNTYTHLPDSKFNEATNWDAVVEHLTSSRNPYYLTGSFLRFAGGALVALLNAGLQTISEKWRTFRFKRGQGE